MTSRYQSFQRLKLDVPASRVLRITDASLALEFLGFTGPELQEGMASLRAKRKPSFPPSSPL
jgi:hypothetical protein